MPAVANIVLANGETTPVNHTFAPLGKDPQNGFFWFEDMSPRVASTSSLGWPRIGIKTVRAPNNGQPGQSAKNQVNEVHYVIQMPALEALGTSDSGLTPPATVAYRDTAKGIFYLPARDTLADRKDLLAYSKNLHANALIVDLVHNLTSLYGG